MSKLDLFHSQIVALYIKTRSDFYNFIKTCSKNKNAALSLKVNNFPMIFGDELRFPNIETQYIFEKNSKEENILIYPNRKIKYKYQVVDKFIMDANKTEIVLNNNDKFKNSKRCHINNRYNIYLFIHNSFDSLVYLTICNVDNDSIDINIELPHLKYLFITYSNKCNIKLNTPSLKYLNIPYFKSVKIESHNLIAFHTAEPKNIDCNFHYPFYYNGIKCQDIHQYLFLSKLIFNLSFHINIICSYRDNYASLNDELQNQIDFILMFGRPNA